MVIAGDRTQADYEQLPYPSLPVTYTQPASLAAMAHVFGIDAPSVECARVLELGCASGGNLIPLAARFPRASFVGIDLAQSHVGEAAKRIAQLGLSNISIRQGDLASATFEREAFDYIICHGVFSWVAKPAQDAIFRICNQSLSKNGVAAISYNVFPGWHMRRIVRDICLFHAGTGGTPDVRVAKARKALTRIASALGGESPYATLLRGEAERLAKAPAAYMLGEFLAEDNQPCYFADFAARAVAADLGYVCEGDLASSLPEYFFPPAAKEIRAMAGGRASAVQQQTDFFSGRPFRRSLLVRAERLAKMQPALNAARLRDLHFAADLKDADHTAEAPVFSDARGRKLTSKNPDAVRMLRKLSSAYPATLALNELTDAPSKQAAALKALLVMLGRGQATVSAYPLKVGAAHADKPLAWPLARTEAAARQPWATGQHHQAVKLTPSMAKLVTLLDGSHDRPSLLRAIGGLPGSGKGDVEEHLGIALSYCARHGLLKT